MRKKISQKLKEVHREHGRLEQDLAFHQKNSNTSPNNSIVEMNISIEVDSKTVIILSIQTIIYIYIYIIS